jgi:hypothetical protein
VHNRDNERREREQPTVEDFEESTFVRWSISLDILHSRLNLRRLRLCNCRIGDAVVNLICSNFPLLVWMNLRNDVVSLDINFITDVGAEMVSKYLRHLVVLYLSRLISIT